jgi:hypothetical protein
MTARAGVATKLNLANSDYQFVAVINMVRHNTRKSLASASGEFADCGIAEHFSSAPKVLNEPGGRKSGTRSKPKQTAKPRVN